MDSKNRRIGFSVWTGAWLPVHHEPVFETLKKSVEANPERYPQYAGVLPDYSKVVCPVWEKIQPRMIQLKTNYFDLGEARRQADIFADTLRLFS